MANGGEFFVGYLGVINEYRLSHILDAGLAFMPVTLGGASYDGAVAVAQCQALKIPPGVTVWRDFEGYRKSPKEAIADLRRWALPVRAAGYEAGLYVAPPQPLSGPELYSLPFTSYWTSAGRVQSVDGRIWDEPYPAGWAMRQLWHNNPSMGGQWWPQEPVGVVTFASVWVDVNYIHYDRKGRLPTWVRL